MKKIIALILCLCITIGFFPVHAFATAEYDYSSFIGEWHKIDPDQLNGDVVLEIIEVINNQSIRFSLDGKVVQENLIHNNQVSWTEQWWDGPMGLTLTFNDDHIHLQYSRYSEEWYSEIVFVSTTATPKKLKDSQKIDVTLNGESVSFDQPPVIVNGRTLVPIRAVVEKMGGTVLWDGTTRTTTLTLNNDVIKLTIDSTMAYLNNEPKVLDVAPQIINDRTLLPIRFVAENFGYDVDWNGDTRTVIIVSESRPTINVSLLKNIGASKVQITAAYGNITDSYYYLGGKYYKHGTLKSGIFYENPDNEYDYSTHDDVPLEASCLHMEVVLSELIPNIKKEVYSISDLQKVFGSYELVDNLDDDNFPECYYTFHYGNYIIQITSDVLNPQVKTVFVFKN